MKELSKWTQPEIDALAESECVVLYKQACGEFMEEQKQRQKRLLAGLALQIALLGLAVFFLSSVPQYAISGTLAYTFTQTFNRMLTARRCVKAAKSVLQRNDFSPEEARDGLKKLLPLISLPPNA